MTSVYVPSTELVTWHALFSTYAIEIVEHNKQYIDALLNVENSVQVFSFEDIKSDDAWEDKLRTTVYSIMDAIKMNRKYFDLYINKWRETFTAASYQFHENYEIREKVGDSIAKSALLYLMFQLFPDVTPQTMSESASLILSKPIQGKISKDLGWAATLRTGFVSENNGVVEYGVTTSTAEDLFESIFGTVYEIGNLIGSGGGDVYARNLIRWLVSGAHIHVKNNVELPDKTAVNQLFQSKRWGKVGVEYAKKGDLVVAKMKFTPRAIADLKYNSSMINFTTSDMVDMIDNPDRTATEEENTQYIALAEARYFGVGTGKDQITAKEAAYHAAADELRKVGLLTNIDRVRGYSQFTTLDLLPYFKPAYLKAKSRGYANLYVTKKAKKSDETTEKYDAQLFGSRDDGSIDLLLTAIFPASTNISLNEQEIRIKLYKEYVKSVV